MARYGHVDFCEDIRREVGGQRSLIGCYANSLKIRDPLPYILPKLCLDITFYSLKSEPYEKLEYQIFTPGDDEVPFKSFVAKVDRGLWTGDMCRPDGSTFMTRNRVGLYFIGFPLNEAGNIVVYAVCDDERLRIGGLRVVKPAEIPAKVGDPAEKAN